MNTRKYYNYETMFSSRAEALKNYLNLDLGIYAEVSGAGNYYHFEILATEAEAATINDYLDSLE